MSVREDFRERFYLPTVTIRGNADLQQNRFTFNLLQDAIDG
jgi:hypothetical protein